MQKKRLLLSFLLSFILGIFLINLASAQFYGSFSITDFLYSIDPTVMTLAVLFIIIFAFSFFSLSKIFKNKYGEPNKTMAGVVALAFSALIIYWINRADLNFEGFFYNIGFSSDLLYIILPIIILAGIIWLSVKIGFGNTLLILGALFIVVTFTGLIYEKGVAFAIGLVLIVIGLWLRRRRKRGPRLPRERGYRPSRPRRPSSWSFSGPRQEWISKKRRPEPVFKEELERMKAREKAWEEGRAEREAKERKKAEEKEQRRRQRKVEREVERNERALRKQREREEKEQLGRQREVERKMKRNERALKKWWKE